MVGKIGSPSKTGPTSFLPGISLCVTTEITPSLLENNLRVLDLSADYRFKSLDKWKQVYSNSFKQLVIGVLPL